MLVTMSSDLVGFPQDLEVKYLGRDKLKRNEIKSYPYLE